MLTQKTEAINVKSLEVQALQDSRNPDQEASLWTKVCCALIWSFIAPFGWLSFNPSFLFFFPH